MRKKNAGAIAIQSFALLLVLGKLYLFTASAAVQQPMAQDAPTPYPSMAPIDQYLMTDQAAEIALTRCRDPRSWTAWFRNRGQR